MTTRSVLVFAVLLFAMIGLPSSGLASPTNNVSVWSFGGLYVHSYQVRQSGAIAVVFEDKNGNVFTGWMKDGHRCPRNPKLQIHPNYRPKEELAKTILAAGIARKKLHVWFWGTTDGDDKRACYIKLVEVTM